MLKNYIDIPEKLWGGIYQTGSTVICSPPVLDTDIDFVIWTYSHYELESFLLKEGFKLSTKDAEEYDLNTNDFSCYRRGAINLITTTDHTWYLKWVLATKVAKKLNLLKKADRITLFKSILYGVV